MFKPNRKGLIAVVSGIATSVALVCSCAGGGNQNSDLQNMQVQYPDYYRLVMNVDGHPTIGMMCVNGAGIMTTSRNMDAATPMPQWDAFCKTQVGSKFSHTGLESDEPAYTP